MATVQLSQRPLLVFIGAIVLHVVLISAQISTTAGIPVIQAVTFGAFAELQRGTMQTVNRATGLWSGYVDLREVQAENEALKRENQQLQLRLQEERAQAQRTESLREILDLRQRAGVTTIASEIIAGPATAEFRDMTIDKGTADGLKPDMAVIAPAGVVGRVTLPSRRAARVQMLIDRNAAAGAMIERTRVQGVITGQGDMLRMDFVLGTADVKQGDVIVTSGNDKIYPKGFVIGTVETIDRGPGAYHLIVVRPAVDFSRLEDVLVVTTPPPALEPDDSAPGASGPARPAPATGPAANATPRSSVPAAPGTARNAPPSAPRNAPAGAPRNVAPRTPGNGGPAAPTGDRQE